MDTELCFKSAVDLARLIRSREISVAEVMSAFVDRIKNVNPKVNAICTSIGDEAAMRLSNEADAHLQSGGAVGPLFGLPWAVKDLVPTAGIRTTLGSPIYKGFVP